MNFHIDDAEFRPLIRRVVAEAIEQIRADEAKLSGRLAFPEPEAAALMGVAPHVLRDCRLRGEIVGRKVGKRTVYERDELLRFLRKERP